jgi:tetratricopeptide (TPR) repeat protein
VPRRPSPDQLAQLVPAVVALLLYAATIGAGFPFEDGPALVLDGRIHDPSYLPKLLGQPYWPHYGTLWRPVTSLSFVIDWALGGGRPWIFHAGNVLLHALLSALVARLALRWMSPVAAAAAGLLFATQPLHVEVVASAVGRADLLCTLGLLGVLLAATRDGPPTVPRLRLIALCSFVALGAKETGVVAPVLALGGAWAVTRTPWSAWRSAWWSASAVAALLTARVIVLGTIAGDAPHPAWWVAVQWKGLWLALSQIPHAAAMLALPMPGVWEHSPTLATATAPSLALAALGAGLLVAAIALAWRVKRQPSVWSIGVFVTLFCWLPVSNLIIKSGIILAERALYPASVGAALVLAAAIAAVDRWRPQAASAVLVLLAGVGAAVTMRDLPAWRDSRAVFEAMTTRNPESYRAWWYLAEERQSRGDRAGAYDALGESLRHFDLETKILHRAAQYALANADTARAITWLDRALEIDVWGRRARTLRVMIAMRQGDLDVARRLLDAGLAFEPDQRTWQQWRAAIAAATTDPSSPPR